ncbi:tetratricopeptide repeat protein [Streptomyces bauhiniae]|uniref:Helix-turn-helix domain-containing protein n=1 Tax=Streptomyces bauhiniae TaxID=2340725 RepID=A0A7K3QQ41_9ACTN|nr:helix-turn-helix domain-containing protein [Streptomyces bauhiniae]
MTEEGAETFGGLLRALRHAHSMTLEALAETSGVSARGIGDLERGRRSAPQRRTVAALARGLGLTEREQQDLFDAARTRRTPRAYSTTGVRSLPGALDDFVGREGELAQLAQLAGTDEARADRPVVAILCGPPGAGKTTLALQAAGRLHDLFPGGRLFVDLRGADEQRPTAAESILGVLKALGVPDRELQRSGPQGHPALYREVLADRRCLLVLDNARDETQVRPLLPGSGSTMLLVTSRRMLTGLDNVHRLQVGELRVHDSTAFLSDLVGAERAAPDPDALADVAALCGNLPLALRVAGNWMATRTDWSTRRLADSLAQEENRLDTLAAGDLHVAAAFDLSYRQLSPCAARMFRRLVLVPGSDSGVACAARVTGQGLLDAEDALEELVEAGLLGAVGSRYRLHDLLRLYARRCLTSEESADEIAAAQSALYKWLLECAVLAGRWYEPDHGAPPADSRGTVDLPDAETAREWLQAEGDNWLAAFRAAAAAGDHAVVAQTAEALHWFSDHWIFWGHWTEIFGTAAHSARALEDPLVEATQLNYLAWAVMVCDGRPRDALSLCDEALAAARRADNAVQQAWAHVYRALAFRYLGESDQAHEPLNQAAEIFEAAGDVHGLLQALHSRAKSLELSGRTREALVSFRETLAWLDETDDRIEPHISAFARHGLHEGLGRCYSRYRQWPEAMHHHRTAVDIAHGGGNIAMLSRHLVSLAEALEGAGRVEEARDALRRCLSLGPDAAPERVAHARDLLARMPASESEQT